MLWKTHNIKKLLNISVTLVTSTVSSVIKTQPMTTVNMWETITLEH